MYSLLIKFISSSIKTFWEDVADSSPEATPSGASAPSDFSDLLSKVCSLALALCSIEANLFFFFLSNFARHV